MQNGLRIERQIPKPVAGHEIGMQCLPYRKMKSRLRGTWSCGTWNTFYLLMKKFESGRISNA